MFKTHVNIVKAHQVKYQFNSYNSVIVILALRVGVNMVLTIPCFSSRVYISYLPASDFMEKIIYHVAVHS